MWWTSEAFSLTTDDAREALLPVSIQTVPPAPWARRGIGYVCLSQPSPTLVEVLDARRNVVAATRHHDRYIPVRLGADAHTVRLSGPFVPQWSTQTQP